MQKTVSRGISPPRLTRDRGTAIVTRGPLLERGSGRERARFGIRRSVAEKLERNLKGGKLGGFEHALGRLLDIPNDAKHRKQFETVVRDVNLPSEELHVCGRGVVVMVIVPSLTQRDQCQNETVSTGIRRLITNLAEHVTERVDHEGSVI